MPVSYAYRRVEDGCEGAPSAPMGTRPAWMSGARAPNRIRIGPSFAPAFAPAGLGLAPRLGQQTPPQIMPASAPGAEMTVPLAMTAVGVAGFVTSDLLPAPWNMLTKIAAIGVGGYGIFAGVKSVLNELGAAAPSAAVVTTAPVAGKEGVQKARIRARIDKPTQDEAVEINGFFNQTYTVALRLYNDSDAPITVPLVYVADEIRRGTLDELKASYVSNVTLPPKQWISVTFEMPIAHTLKFITIDVVGTVTVADAVLATTVYTVGLG